MLATTIRSPPSMEDFVPLSEYQSQTPESFADGKPVLHFHLQGATASIPKSQCGSLALFPADAAANAQDGPEGRGEPRVECKADVFVNSDCFTVFSQEAQAGVLIPYPSISIHAVKQVDGQAGGNPAQAVWMQLEFSDGGANDDDFNTVEMTIIPHGPEGGATQLFDAISSCSDLHPDPANDGDDDESEFDRIVFDTNAEHEALEGFAGVLRGSSNGDLPPPMPGSGGWITAENAHVFFDDDGNWIARDGDGDAAAGEPGEGGGRTRPRAELDSEGINGHATDDDHENKRPRVDD
ncbi:hypothetical protein CDD83_3221 [Cordyceps sp. RAO-2017]|nr:hypothetical protein CDD83_3221 [Cordyceps sp. RAO-2017]